jgi:selenocysteine-specific elongation factor
MAIIATAGHIDHGKSALVKALTSIDPDRLPEEKQREMTIDLGFAWLPLASGEVVGIIDVPGHEDFIDSMIAGVGGIDAAILVIAQDEGWMPQTEEHRQILDLLDIRRGVVALTKIDLNDDPEWLDLVEDDVRGRLKGTGLAEAPIVRVSARLGTNIEELKQKIEELVSKLPPKRDVGKPRLPIDRVFSIKGSGVVITGTLVDGTLSRGDDVYIFPRDSQARIRGLESYKEKRDSVPPGTRVALNLVGLEKEDLGRGDTIFGQREQVKSSKIIDVSLELVPQLSSPLKSDTEYKLYFGTTEIVGRILLLGRESLKGGESALAQLRFSQRVATRLGDHFIMRRVSPTETIGGGTVLDPVASKHKFRDMANVNLFLQRRASLELEELILSELDRDKYIEGKELLAASGYSAPEVAKGVESLHAKDKLKMVGLWVVDLAYWQTTTKQVLDILANEHQLHPLEKGLPQAELQSVLHLPKGLFDQLIATLVEQGKIARKEGSIALTTHQPSISPEQQITVSQTLKLIKANRAKPLTRKELTALLPDSEAVVRYMCQDNLIVELSEGVLFERSQYEGIKNEVINFLRRNNTMTIQEMRSLFGFSRKYIIQILNKMEEEGIIRRRGEERVLTKRGI